MADEHEYDQRGAERLEALYTSSAAIERRRLVRDRLDLGDGEAVLCIGCGPGFEPAEIAEVVGLDGHVLGVDVSEAVLSLARGRCADLPQVTLEPGDAAELPVEDERFDAAVAVQTFEYVPDVDAALAELHRALRPGGRAAIYSTDWDNVVWHSADPDRMATALDAWSDVYAHPHLGSQLAGHVHDAGFDVEHVEPNSILNTHLDGTFAGFTVDLVRDHLEGVSVLDPADVEAWERDLRELDAAGETFFNLTQYPWVVSKPA